MVCSQVKSSRVLVTKAMRLKSSEGSFCLEWYALTRWLQNNPMPMLLCSSFEIPSSKISEIQLFSHSLMLGKDNAQRAKVFTAKKDYVLNFSSASWHKAALALQSCRFVSMVPFLTNTLMESNMPCSYHPTNFLLHLDALDLGQLRHPISMRFRLCSKAWR